MSSRFGGDQNFLILKNVYEALIRRRMSSDSSMSIFESPPFLMSSITSCSICHKNCLNLYHASTLKVRVLSQVQSCCFLKYVWLKQTLVRPSVYSRTLMDVFGPNVVVYLVMNVGWNAAIPTTKQTDTNCFPCKESMHMFTNDDSYSLI